MASEDNVSIFSGHIMNTIAEIRKSKKRPDKKSMTEFIQKNHAANADYNNFIDKAIEKLIENKKIINKPTIQGMKSYFVISNDQLDQNKVTESEPVSLNISISPSSNISVHETSSNCQPFLQSNGFDENEVFNTFY